MSEGARIRYVRNGWTEWYENGPDGLEQGFTIMKAPPGTGFLRIEGSFEGSLSPELCTEQTGIDLLDDNGVRTIRYAELRATDACGREVTSRLELNGGDVALVVEDEGAVYPITIDPLVTSPSWTAEGNQAGAMFGASVSTAGDVNGDGFSDVAVGAPLYDNGRVDAGRVYLFLGSSGGLPSAASWMADGDQEAAHLGTSVGPAGDVNGDGYDDLIVGEDQYDAGDSDEGRVCVFLGSAGGVSATPSWTAEGDQAGARFGASVGTAGDVNGDGYADVIVGAPFENGSGMAAGKAYVYLGSSEGLLSPPSWTGEGGQDGAEFGEAVATAGDVNGDGFADVLVGSPFTAGGSSDPGRAYLYLGSASGLATAASWTGEGSQAGEAFGWAAGSAGDLNGDGFSDVVVGAPLYGEGENEEGRVCVYYGAPSGLPLMASWVVEGGQAGAEFGASVATAGDTNADGYADLVVGAPSYDNGQTGQGRACVYQGSPAGLTGRPAWTTEGDQAGAGLGCSVATAGDVNGDGYSEVLVGAASYDNGQTDEGRVYLFKGCGSGPLETASWTGAGSQAGEFYGHCVHSAGDVNGDGYSDVIVGADGFDGGQVDDGRAYLYFGSSQGLKTDPSWMGTGDQVHAFFGVSADCAGDVNGDGYSDVIVGAYRAGHGLPEEGLAYVYLGSPDGLAAEPAWQVRGGQALAWLGYCVAGAGDVNGDGYSDVIVGVGCWDGDLVDEGQARIYLGSPQGLSTTPAWTAEGDRAGAAFGISVSSAGDVNGDGFSDVIVGAYRYANPQYDEGRVCVYYGSPGGPGTSPGWAAEGNQENAHLGISVSTAGDVNGDGYSDVIAGAYEYTNGEFCEGRAYVYNGSPSGLSSTPSWRAEGNQALARFGACVATAGDVNGDGYSDVIVGVQFWDDDQTDEGRACLYLGSSTGLEATPSWTVEGDTDVFPDFGWCVSTVGDVNGDGFSDVAVGADYYAEGRAFVYYGNSGVGLSRSPVQARAVETTPIFPLCRSDAEGAFRLKVAGRTPMGRGKVCLQYEVKPFGVPFDGTGVVTGPEVDTGVPGLAGSVVPLSDLVSGLSMNTLYHWRLRTATDSPFFPRSRWYTLPYNSVTEADLRTSDAISDVHGLEGTSPLAVTSAPNPFRTSSTISYTVAEPGVVRLAVYDATGREIAVLVNGAEEAGPHQACWDGRYSGGAKCPAGIYFERLQCGGREAKEKVVLAR